AEADIVLVVEDDPDASEALCDLLRGEGYSTIAATDGQMALDYLQSGALPCMIILDLLMPIMDGWRFRERLRENPALDRIPVVVVTAFGNRSPSDVVATFQKPINIPSLLETVARYC
ncbi:MAG: response regulator, partial [Candidatus Binataceae bacterium]